jgi:hypothetical protein
MNLRTITALGQAILSPAGTPLARVSVQIMLVSADGVPCDAWDVATGSRVVGQATLVSDTAGVFPDVALWPNSQGSTATMYRCVFSEPHLASFMGVIPYGETPLTWVQFMAGSTPLTPQQISVLDAHIGDAAVHFSGLDRSNLTLLSNAVSSSVQLIAAVPISGHVVVATDENGQAVPASNLIASNAYAIAGVTMGAAVLGAPTTVRYAGELTEPTWNWIPNLPLFLGESGSLTQVAPTAPAVVSLVLGYAITPTQILIQPKTPMFII